MAGGSSTGGSGNQVAHCAAIADQLDEERQEAPGQLAARRWGSGGKDARRRHEHGQAKRQGYCDLSM